MGISPANHGGVLLDSRLEQPLQNGPFPHGAGEVAERSEETDFGQPTLLARAESFQERSVSEGLGPVAERQLPFDLYTLTCPLCVMCVSVSSWACPTVLLFLLEERC